MRTLTIEDILEYLNPDYKVESYIVPPNVKQDAVSFWQERKGCDPPKRLLCEQVSFIKEGDFWIKPLLHPMERVFDKIIEVDGEMKSISEILNDQPMSKQYISGVLHEEWYFIERNGFNRLCKRIPYDSTTYFMESDQMPNWAIKLLAKYHFDFKNLIGQGLAEPIQIN